MNEKLLRIVLVFAYGPFVLMALVFLSGLLLKLSGDPFLLEWLISKTGPQQPIRR